MSSAEFIFSRLVPLLVFFRLRRTVQPHLRLSQLLPQVLWVEKTPTTATMVSIRQISVPSESPFFTGL